MNRNQARIIEANGFGFDRVADLTPQPRAKYYSRDKGSGKVVEHNLPADAYSLRHYLRRGLVLNPNDLPPLEQKPVAVSSAQ
jgi:hypothetical protein